jgi:biopolymer transport protein ExbB/TolQ
MAISMASGPSLWKACGPVALPLLLLSLAVLTVGFERCWFWGRWWWRDRRPRVELLQELEACPTPQARAALLCRQQRLMAWGEPLLQASQILAPMLGLVGTTAGLMAVLRSLGNQLLLPPGAPLAGYADVLLPTLLSLQLALLATALLLLNQGLRRWQLELLRRQGSEQP